MYSQPAPSGIVFNATLNANMAIADATYAPIKYDTVISDPTSSWSAATGRFTPKTAGQYLVIAASRGQVATTLSSNYVAICKNGLAGGAGTILGQGLGGSIATSSSLSSSAQAIVSCNGTTDTIEIDGQVNGTGGSNAVRGGTDGFTYAIIRYLGP